MVFYSIAPVITTGKTMLLKLIFYAVDMFLLFVFLQGGARVLAFDQHHAVLVVSKPSPNQLFPGFGIVKVNLNFTVYCCLLWR